MKTGTFSRTTVGSTVLAVFWVSIWPATLFAECESWHLEPWPSTDKPLPTNGHIVLEGFGGLRDLVVGISGNSPKLVANTERVPLKVNVAFKGQVEVAQAVLAPVRELKPHMKYVLEISNVEEDTRRMWESDKLSWTTAAGPDKISPKWSAPPVVSKKEYIRFGCGPAILVHFKAPIEDDGLSSAVFVEIKRTANGKDRPGHDRFGQKVEWPVRYIVPAKDSGVSLGHGMCSGPFEFSETETYSATFSAIDAAGNETRAPGPPVEFTGPPSELP